MATAASLQPCEPRHCSCARARRVLVVHRFPVVRFGVMKLVEEHLPDIVTAGAGTVSQALRLVRASNWDLVVTGLSFDQRSGLDVLRSIQEHLPTLRVLVLSAHAEELYARRCFEAGAAGFVTSDSSPTELIDAIHTVMSGVRYVSPRATERSGMTPSSRGGRPAARLLSDRELEVMRLLAWGTRVDEIAVLLSVTLRAVRTCRARVIRKLARESALPPTRSSVVRVYGSVRGGLPADRGRG
jgi:two-component system invasion response regulator UvrY